MNASFTFRTDTATVAIFDPTALAHRKMDAADWWSNPRHELRELNEGNLMLVGLAADGDYDVDVTDERMPTSSERAISALIKCQSGNIHIGPGEDLPADGFEPAEGDPYTSGKSFACANSTLRIYVQRIDARGLRVFLCNDPGSPKNQFERTLSLK